MQNKILLLITIFLMSFLNDAVAQNKAIVTVENSLKNPFPDAPVVINRTELNIPEGKSVISITTVKDKNTWEIPFQLDDLDKNGKWDELFFQIDFESKQIIDVEINFGEDKNKANKFLKRVNAVIDDRPRDPWTVYKPLWESEIMTYLTYGATQIDVIGKTIPRLSLDYFYGEVKHPQHTFSAEFGHDFLLTANTMSLHSIFIQEANGNIARPWTTNAYSISKKIERDAKYDSKILADGPLRAIVKTKVTDWRTDLGTYEFEIVYSIASLKRYTTVELKMTKYPGNKRDIRFGAGMRQIYEDFVYKKKPEYMMAIAQDVYEAGILNHLIARGIVITNKYDTEEIYIKNDTTLIDIPNNGPNYGFLFPKGTLELKYGFAGAWEKDGGVTSPKQWANYLLNVSDEIGEPVIIKLILLK
ncbi:MAG: DUF4861 domain-containing protein [Bacteroidetes bacterium]|nr:DUF4861 domain-containing protein [Bacteroidota bacterium]